MSVGISTRPRPPQIEEIVAYHNYVLLTWSLAEHDYNENIKAIIIEYAHVKDKKWDKVIIKDPAARSYSITNLSPATDYKLRLVVKNVFGKSEPTPIEHITTGKS